jgi:pilus assembly protein CpaC
LFLVYSAGAGLRAQTSPAAAQAAGAPIQDQDSANDLAVSVGKTVLVDTAWPIRRVAINLPEIADVHATGPTEVMVQGKTAGETSLIIWDSHGGRQFFNVTVRASNAALNDSLDAIRREIRTELPGQTIKLSSDNGTIFIRGTVKDLDSSARASKIAGTAGKVVNLLNVEVPASEPQILLKVRFASIDLTKETQLGINLFSTGFGNTIGGISTGQFSPPTLSGSNPITISGLSGSSNNLYAFYPGLDIGATITALQQRNIIDILAEPNVMATNGQEASFLAGGEYPYPVPQASSGGAPTITIMFKEYGVRLNFIPTITPRGTIRLQVAPEVSTLDFAGGIQLSGFDIPAINTRRMKTEVELSDGQSFAISGLLDHRDNETFDKVPFLSDIPILGKFFQSQQKTKTNTELIVIVTPEIIAPIPAGEPLPELKYPGKFLPPITGIPMNNPDAKTAANTLPPAPPTLPVEKLMDSMKPEKPLVIDTAGGFGGSSATAVDTSSVPTPVQ